MNSYCKTIISECRAGADIFEICNRPGMPALYTVKQWLFNREYHHEFNGFRYEFLRLQETKFLLHTEKVYDYANSPDQLFKVNANGRAVICREKKKEYNEFLQALQWFSESLRLLRKLYECHEAGKDFSIEGIHFSRIISPPKPAFEPSNPHANAIAGLRPGDNNLQGSGAILSLQAKDSQTSSVLAGVQKPPYHGPKTNFSPTLTREQAEKILGTLLLYGRLNPIKKTKPKPANPAPNIIVRPPNESPSPNFIGKATFGKQHLSLTPPPKEITQSIRNFLLSQNLIPP